MSLWINSVFGTHSYTGCYLVQYQWTESMSLSLLYYYPLINSIERYHFKIKSLHRWSLLFLIHVWFLFLVDQLFYHYQMGSTFENTQRIIYRKSKHITSTVLSKNPTSAHFNINDQVIPSTLYTMETYVRSETPEVRYSHLKRTYLMLYPHYLCSSRFFSVIQIIWKDIPTRWWGGRICG